MSKLFQSYSIASVLKEAKTSWEMIQVVLPIPPSVNNMYAPTARGVIFIMPVEELKGSAL